jgi:hypothetical protein
MANHCLLLLLFLMAVAAVLLTATSANRTSTILSGPPTAYNMLTKFGFPPGIIPQGVQGYDLRQDGSFEMHFAGECALHVVGFKVRYSSRLAGNIGDRAIFGLEGVKVKIAFLWIRITEVTRAGGDIKVRLRTGGTMSYPVGDFSIIPQC